MDRPKQNSSYEIYAKAVLAFCVAVILWGAYVRASGSGAGCGSHWPLCNGSIIPRAERIQTKIEFSHRLSSGFSLILVFALFLWTRIKFPRGSFSHRAALLALLAMISEALVGALLVLLHYVELDKSVGRVLAISLHLSNTLFLLAALTVCVLAIHEAKPRWRWPVKEGRGWPRGLLVGFVFLGVLGAVTALGDTLFPATTLREGFSADFDSKRHYIEHLRVLHPLFALSWVGCLAWWLPTIWDRMPSLGRHGRFLLGFAALNLCLGILNILLLAPIWLQITHLLVADVLWILFVGFLFSAASRWQ